MGVIILGMGILYMLLMRNRLVREGRRARASKWDAAPCGISSVITGWRGRARRLAIRPDSPDRPDPGRAAIACPLRGQRHRDGALAQVQAGDGQCHRGDRVPGQDVLLIDMSDPEVDVREFCSEARLEPMILRGEYFSDQAREVGMAEVSPSRLPAARQEHPRGDLPFPLRPERGGDPPGWRGADRQAGGRGAADGDTLLVVGNWSLIRQLQTHHRDFLLLGLPAEVDEMAPARSQAIHALIALGVMIVLMVTDPVPNVIAALIACLLMGKFRCIDLESAYKSIHWPTLILIVGMLPFALALQQTGGVDLIVGALISAVGRWAPG